MRPTRMVGTLLALACLAAAGAPIQAQTHHIHNGQSKEDVRRADALLVQALELERSADRKDWVKAAKLRVESAGLRGCSDPEVFQSLYMAGRVYEQDGKLQDAVKAFESAAEHALHTGDVVNAADAYITMAWVAKKLGDEEATHSHLARALDLSCSPLLTRDQVAAIRNRIDDNVSGGG